MEWGGEEGRDRGTRNEGEGTVSGGGKEAWAKVRGEGLQRGVCVGGGVYFGACCFDTDRGLKAN